jgi:hypothetical protein
LELLDFIITSAEDDSILNFTITLNDPYLFGLLNKKNDNLVIVKKATADASEFLYNTTANVLGNNKTTYRIGMQFDYRSNIHILHE